MKQTLSEAQKEDVLEHLAALQNANGFEENSRKYKILEYLVKAELEGNGDRLKAYAIGVDVLNRGSSFDPSTDSIVRVEIARLRTALDLQYLSNPSRIRFEVPKGTYRPTIVVDDLTAVPKENSPNPSNYLERKAIVGVFGIALAILLGAAFSVHKLYAPSASEILTDRPIVLLSGDVTSGQMSRASETLPHFRNLYTIQPMLSSVHDATYEISFRTTSSDASFVGQLVHMPTGQIIASEHFTPDRSEGAGTPRVDHWLASIAQLNGVIEKDYMRRGEYSRAFRCRHLTETYFGNQTDQTHLAARNCLQELIDQGEDSPTLHANLALILREEHSDQRNLLPGNALHRAVQAARTAIELEPFDANNHYALMTVLFMMGSIPEAITAGDRAVRLAPLDGYILGGYAARLITIGHYEQALEMFDRSIEINPGQLNWRHYGMFNAYIGLGQRESAADVSLTLEGSENPLYLAASAIGLNIMGRTSEALPLYEALLLHESDVRDMYDRRQYDPRLVQALMDEIELLELARQSQ